MPAIFSLLFTLLAPTPGLAAMGFDPAIREEAPLAEEAFFTANSVRRDPRSRAEIANIVGVKANLRCTGFLVANTRGKSYVGTARHCANYDLASACRSQKLKLTSALNGAEGRCVRLVAGSEFDDLQLLEVEFNGGPPARGYRFAAYLPGVGDPFRVYGYPEDPERARALTVTESCGDFSSARAKPRYGSPSAAGPQWNTSNADDAPVRLQRLFQWHNCSVFGGNSGGPIVAAGTDVVVGVPTVYQSQLSVRYQATDVMPYETTAGFVKRNRAALTAAGVVLVENAADAAPSH